uniref:T-complex protein 1 subunit eta-like n=1 Tax=Erigeron canadensis TaxID=72917 RepID=UPI001CB940F8|nr:T-complex protein 1 subunit eta-like [Erigeron canadensis]
MATCTSNDTNDGLVKKGTILQNILKVRDRRYLKKNPITQLERMQKPYASLLSDEDVLRPILRSELKKGADDLIQNGVSVELIKKVFKSVCDMIVNKIKESAVNMEDSKMKGALSAFYATQLQKELFPSEPSRKHMAEIMVGAVHAAGYDHEYVGPFRKILSEYEDGYESIGIIKVSGGCVDDCFFEEGIAFKPRGDGFNERKVVNPKILLLNIKPVQNINERVDLNIEDILNKTQKNHVKDRSIVVLSCQALDEDAKKVLASRHICFADLVSEVDLRRIAGATCACIISSSNDCRLSIVILFYLIKLYVY